MWYSNDMSHYVSKAEFVTLASLKVPSGKKRRGGQFLINSANGEHEAE